MENVFLSKSENFAVYKLGNKVVNWYMITTQSEIYLVDTGFAGFWNQFVKALRKLNRNFNEISAVLLTHAHMDHTGFAERARQRTTANVYIHESAVDTVTFPHFDVPLELTGNLWRPRTLFSFMFQALKNDAFKIRPVGIAKGYKDNEELEVPGKPRVIYTPGHSIDHCAFYLQKFNILFSGDAICTSSPITFRNYPPHVMKAGDDIKLATQSLERFLVIEEDVLLLPGHGKPWKGNLRKEIPNIIARGALL